MQTSVPLLLEEGCVGTDDLLGTICMDPHLHISIHNLVGDQICITDDMEYLHQYTGLQCLL